MTTARCASFVVFLAATLGLLATNCVVDTADPLQAEHAALERAPAPGNNVKTGTVMSAGRAPLILCIVQCMHTEIVVMDGDVGSITHPTQQECAEICEQQLEDTPEEEGINHPDWDCVFDCIDECMPEDVEIETETDNNSLGCFYECQESC